MGLKLTPQGLLVYLTMAGMAGAFFAYLSGARRVGRAIFGGAFLAGVAALGWRTYHTGHAPLKNMFDIFLFLGVICFPGSMFCRYVLKTGGETHDPALGFLLLFPVGFVFSAQPEKLPPALQHWLWIPHVAAYMLAYLVMFKAALEATTHLLKADPLAEDRPGLEHEKSAYRLVLVGFPLLTLGLLLGAWWGKIAWGDYWNWDPKELWSLAGWLVYVGYLHFRSIYGRRYARVNSTLAVFGALVIVITLLWVNLSRVFSGLHSYA